MTDEIEWMILQRQIESYVADQIKQLEKRIIQLEVKLSTHNVRDEDAWYWDH